MIPKVNIREKWKGKVHPERESASRGMCEHALNSPEFRVARFVGLFYGMPTEPDLKELWLARPTECAFPVVDEKNKTLEFYTVAEWTDLAPGYKGILEPPRNSSRLVKWGESDLVLVPGLGFDLRGGRVGSGAGFYDRFLFGKAVKKWGICFEERISEEWLAQDLTDVRMDAILTERGLRRFERSL